MRIYNDTTFKLSEHISWQKINEIELSYVRNIKTKKFYIFKDAEFYIIKFISEFENITSSEIIDKCSELYDIDKKIIEGDIIDFLADLESTGVVCVG